MGFLPLAGTLALCGALAEAQQQTKNPRIGFLTPFSAADTANALRLQAFRRGLQHLGYVEGKNIDVEYRYADRNYDRLPELAQELIRRKIDILVAENERTVRAAQKGGATLPIIVIRTGDPVRSGLVASLARPGGNVTGSTSYSPELVAKRLELLKEIVPNASRFAFLNSSRASGAGFDEAQRTAKALRVQFKLIEIRSQNPDIAEAFQTIDKERIGGFVTSASPPVELHRKRILELAEQNRIPAIYGGQQWADSGGLISYGANNLDLYSRAAVYIDKILKGAKPADLPVEGPTKFHLVVNLRAAKQIGLTIPLHVLARADKVIK